MQGGKENEKRGKYFLDEIAGILYTTDSYTLWKFYHSMFYTKGDEEK